VFRRSSEVGWGWRACGHEGENRERKNTQSSNQSLTERIERNDCGVGGSVVETGNHSTTQDRGTLTKTSQVQSAYRVNFRDIRVYVTHSHMNTVRKKRMTEAQVGSQGDEFEVNKKKGKSVKNAP